jgi:hypothetical protein
VRKVQDQQELVWQKVLDDISKTTGWYFRNQEFDTNQKEIAERVLPILVRWIPRVHDSDSRCALYLKFDTPHAHKYLDLLIRRWKVEATATSAHKCLGEIISRLIKRADAAKLWSICLSEISRGRRDYVILTRLASFPSVSEEVKNQLLTDLAESKVPLTDLAAVSDVNDPRIFAWFKSQLSSPNGYIRNLAAKLVEGRTDHFDDVPELRNEIYSRQPNVSDIPELLKKLPRGRLRR